MRKKSGSKLTPLAFRPSETESAAAVSPSMEDLAEAMFVPAPEELKAVLDLQADSGIRSFDLPAGLDPVHADAELSPPTEERLRKEVKVRRVQISEPARSAKPRAKPKQKSAAGRTEERGMPGWARSAYWIAIPSAVIWAGCMIAFASGYQNPFGPFEFRPFPMVAFAGLCLLPAVFILLAAYAVRQAAKLSVETRRARDMADDLALPVALAADQSGGAAEAVRAQIDRAAAAALAAEHQLLELRRALSEESDRLVEATSDAERRAHALTQNLARERDEMNGLTRSLDGQVQAVSDAIAAQSKMVVEASDLAATQLQEAEAALALRAGDLAAAAGEAGEAADLASQLLSAQADRLQAVGDSVVERVGGLNGALSSEQARLSALADSLREDQQSIADKIEAQRVQLVAASADARDSAGIITEASIQGALSLRDLIASVAEQVGQLAAMAETEQAALREQAQTNLQLFTGVIAEERAALEAETRIALDALVAAAADTRKAAIDQAEAARDRVQQLGESAFALGQQADKAFDDRIGAARQMIEQSAGLVEQAGQKSAERIEAGLTATQGALGDLEKLLTAIDAKVAALPDDARARAETVRAAVEQGIGDLTAAARKAAEETQAIDAVFQGRIKQNYQVLSEALRLMGQVAGAAAATAKAGPAVSMANASPSLAPKATPTFPAPPPASASSTTPVMATPSASSTIPETPRSIRYPAQTYAPSTYPSADDGLFQGEAGPAEPIGLRPRLKLTVEAPAPARSVPPQPAPTTAPPRAAARDESEWTWKDLLSSMDAPPIDDEVLAEKLISEIEALGLDAAILLPLARIDEIAAVMQAGDSAGARDVVRNLAPAAVRRLSRRVLTDKVLRAHADRYLQRYQDLLADSARRDRDGFVTATLLGSDPGRAFLLFNAAVGELH